jgi:hypothetical protein
MSRIVNTNTNTSEAVLPSPGFGEFDVPEMPAYVQSYSTRGSGFSWETTPVLNRTRFGNKTGKGGMDAYLSQVEDPNFFEGSKLKVGDPGVFELMRYGPGSDWRGNFGIASLDASKNYTRSTRGGMLRQGGPRRSDIVDRPNYWTDTVRPGISVSREGQCNDNYSGVYEWKRQTPIVERASDPLVLREAIEHNPFFIISHAAQAAKDAYDLEFGQVRDTIHEAYNPMITNNRAADANITIRDRNPYVLAADSIL